MPAVHILCLLLRFGAADLSSASDGRRVEYLSLFAAVVQLVPSDSLDPCWAPFLGVVEDAQRSAATIIVIYRIDDFTLVPAQVFLVCPLVALHELHKSSRVWEGRVRGRLFVGSCYVVYRCLAVTCAFLHQIRGALPSKQCVCRPDCRQRPVGSPLRLL